MNKNQKKIFLKSILAFFLMVFASGCVVQSLHNKNFVSDIIEERTGQTLRPEKEDVDFALPECVDLSDGMTEDEAVAIALWNNTQFQADLVQLGFARADLIEAGLLRNPILTLLFPLGPKQLEAYIHLPIEFLWQRPKRVAAAKLNVEQVAENLIQHGLDLIRDVRLSYDELLFSREKAKILEEEAGIQGEIVDIASKRLEAGDISGLEETALRLEASRTQEEAIRSARDASLAQNRLRALLGLEVEVDSFELVPVTGPSELDMDIVDLIEVAFAARPDLRAAEIAIESAGFKVGWERSRILSFTAMLDANGEGKEGFEMGPGMQVEIPVFNWNKGKIARAQAELEQATKQYLAVKHRIIEDVIEASTRYEAADQALELLRMDILPSARLAANNAEEAYALGDLS